MYKEAGIFLSGNVRGIDVTILFPLPFAQDLQHNTADQIDEYSFSTIQG